MIRLMKIFGAVSFCIITYSCIDNVLEPQLTISEAQFLISESNNWTYSFYDSLAKKSDIVIIKPSGRTLYDNREEAFIWKLNFTSYSDTHFVFISKNLDSLRIIPNFNSRQRYFKARLKFPLKVGAKWKGEWFNDTVKVIKQENITVAGVTYFGAYYIEQKWGALNEYGLMRFWYLPQVGFIKIVRREWGFSFMNQTWELLKHETRKTFI